MEILALMVLAVIIEAIYDNVRVIWENDRFNLNRVLVIILSIIITVLTGVDLLPMVGLSISVPIVGSVLTGIIVSRGSNVLHDILDKINKVGE